MLLLLLFSINDTAELSSSELDSGSLLSSTLKGSGAAPTARRVGTGRRLRAKSIGPVKIHSRMRFLLLRGKQENSRDALGCYLLVASSTFHDAKPTQTTDLEWRCNFFNLYGHPTTFSFEARNEVLLVNGKKTRLERA